MCLSYKCTMFELVCTAFKSTKSVFDVFKDLFKGYEYGPVYTFWIFNRPHVMVTDVDIAREAFRKNDFAGRPDSYFGSQLSNDRFQDVLFTDYGHTWEALRRVAHSAAQKYSTNDKLVYLAVDCVDQTLKEMLNREGTDRAFNPQNYIYLMFLNIMSASAFGQRYNIEDKEFKQIKYALKDFGKEAGSRFLLWEFSPLLRFLDKKLAQKQRKIITELVEMIRSKFRPHYDDYNESIERDFCDALISAKNDALRDGKESAPHLTDDNLSMTVFDMFFAGTDTSQQTFQWILLLMTYYPEMQQKLRQGIESQIGDRMPTHEDRNRCHYVMAFIAETLRLRNVVPSGIPHKAVVTSTIGNYMIPENTAVMVYQGSILTNKKFVDEHGQFITTRLPAYIPFGLGRRGCLGEKLAIADLFLVLVRFLQSTQDYELVLDSNGGIDPDPNVTDSYSPHEYNIGLDY
ncbi:unnamed protein product [Medioppia subpectinata]|uniref:Cytochrome P450 n=1 Tax=Medioppia subpectinata TaxID=1979941 RepID=A0A7R9KEW3_9ACAR|nr:unnamed protein product [Medioppia subpectinata]CAG2102041.1 unnamed protein product [Medioppia subpectinata]